MGRTFDFLSAFYIGVREMKNVFFFFLYSCLRGIGILAMENEFISMSAFCQRFSLLNDVGNMEFLLVHFGHIILHILITDSHECPSGVSLYMFFPFKMRL
jgi:hypothetical protein